MQIESLLPFLKEIDRLKAVERQTLNHNGGRHENSAEHSWHLAMAVLVFHASASPEVNLLRSLKMALIHDLAEADAGDTFIYGDLTEKNSRESAAIARILNLLPPSIGNELKLLWCEFEEGKSAEARFVAALDRFLPMFSNCLNEGYSWQKHGISLDQVIAKNRPPISNGLPQLWEVAEKMVQSAAEVGHLKRS